MTRFGVALAGMALMMLGVAGAQTVADPGPFSPQTRVSNGDPLFGRSVVISGDITLVGGTGTVYAYQRLAEQWIRIGRMSSTGEDFGRAVDFDGVRAIVGALGEAHIFRLSAGVWVPEVQLTSPVATFGRSVSISGDDALVGSLGAALAYRRIPRGGWRQQGVLTGTPGLSRAVTVRGGRAFVVDRGTLASRGFGYFYERPAADWDRGRVLPDDTNPPVLSEGRSADFDGRTAVASDFAVPVVHIFDEAGSSVYFSMDAVTDSVAVSDDWIVAARGGLMHVLARVDAGWEKAAHIASSEWRVAVGGGVDVSGDTIVLGSPQRGQSAAVAASTVMFYTADRDGDGTRDGLDVCPGDPRNRCLQPPTRRAALD